MVLKNGIKCDKLDVKGLDVVRSSFPKAFQEYMSGMLKDILMGKDNEYVDTKLLAFKASMINLPVNKIAKGGAIKELSKYDNGKWRKDSGLAIANFEKGTPAHVKDGDKVKWVYLRQNPLGLDTVAFKDYNDPKEIMDFVEQYVDRDMIFKAELENKLDDFYKALKWEKASTETQTAKKFFTF
jgi:DNA polymerase elongation subunit (family B)